MRASLIVACGFACVGVFITAWYGPAHAQTLKFEAPSSAVPNYTPFTASVFHVSPKPRVLPQLLGTKNSAGQLIPFTLQELGAMGLGKLTDTLRQHRDARLADIDGDGYLDIVANTYSCPGNSGACQGPRVNAADKALLFLNNQDGTFSEVAAFTSLNINGNGETIVLADFDNDGVLDIYLPYYTTDTCVCKVNSDPLLRPRSRLIKVTRLADRTLHFEDKTEQAGVSLADLYGKGIAPEGAQALDINQDGNIDLYVAGHLFINYGGFKFVDESTSYGLGFARVGQDEGIKFLDWNNDGYLDLLVIRPDTTGPTLFQFDPQQKRFFLVSPSPFPTKNAQGKSIVYHANYGINVYDLDNDGWEDVIISGGAPYGTLSGTEALVFRNVNGQRFELVENAIRDAMSNPVAIPVGYGGPAFGDFNGDGRIDVVFPGKNGSAGTRYFLNQTDVPPNRSFIVWVLGPQGQQNQNGRIVHIRNTADTTRVFTRVVDGGSGYMAQNQYPLLVGTLDAGTYTVDVFFPGSTVSFSIEPGAIACVYAPSSSSKGRVEIGKTSCAEWLPGVLGGFFFE